MRERLAQFAHSQWSRWMKHLFSKGTLNKDGSWTMPKWAVDRWMLQMHTPYNDLSNQEKDSDRKEADGMLEVIASRKIMSSEH